MIVPGEPPFALPVPDLLPAAMLSIAEHAERLDTHDGRLGDLSTRLLTLEELLDDEPDRAGYNPIPAPRWWMLAAAERAEAADRLLAWVDQVYGKSYGHLARMLGPCWADHDLCLFVLDFLSELHAVLYLRHARSARTLADQAEFHLRILPAAAELMRSETSRCDHPHLRGVAA
jgi:hypothetical protein